MELATGRHPYEGCSTDFELLTKIKGEQPPRLDPSSGFSNYFCIFIARCLMKCPVDRPSYKELLVIIKEFSIHFFLTWQKFPNL